MEGKSRMTRDHWLEGPAPAEQQAADDAADWRLESGIYDERSRQIEEEKSTEKGKHGNDR